MQNMMYDKDTQVQVVLTRKVPRLDNLKGTTLCLRVSILRTFFTNTFFPDEEFFKYFFKSKKVFISPKLCNKKDRLPCSLTSKRQ